MPTFGSPEKHDANPPSTWLVVKKAPRYWALTDATGEVVLDRFETKKAATAAIDKGWFRNLWDTETRWYAGESIPKWRPWAEVKAEQEANDLRWGRVKA